MAQDRVTPGVAERRCPNCGTRVARNAESCFMCGYDLRNQPQNRRRISWIDALLVVAVLAVLVFWWRVGTESSSEAVSEPGVQGILPTSIPLLEATATSTPTETPLPTATLPPITTETVLVKHTVESGETLLDIAILYGVSVEEIQQANGLTSELIRVGDELTIPVVREIGGALGNGPASDFSYVVEDGDTLITIALKFGSTVRDIQTINELAANDIIRPGDELVIPVRGVPEEVLQATPAPATAPDSAAPSGPPSSTIYISPRLIAPADGTTIPRTDAVPLQWASVDVLKPNEWYVVQVLPRSPQAQQLPTAWTKQTTYRLSAQLAPPEGELAEYDWLISVVRVQSGAGRPTLEAASPLSDIRRFIWR